MNDSEMIDEMAARIEKLEEPARHVANMETARIQDIEFVKMLYSTVTTQGKRITALEKQVARHAAEAIPNLSVASVEQGQRIDKLEAALEASTLDLGPLGHAIFCPTPLE